MMNYLTGPGSFWFLSSSPTNREGNRSVGRLPSFFTLTSIWLYGSLTTMKPTLLHDERSNKRVFPQRHWCAVSRFLSLSGWNSERLRSYLLPKSLRLESAKHSKSRRDSETSRLSGAGNAGATCQSVPREYPISYFRVAQSDENCLTDRKKASLPVKLHNRCFQISALFNPNNRVATYRRCNCPRYMQDVLAVQY